MDFNNIWCICHLGQYWVKILDRIQYEHHISLNMHIMADHVTKLNFFFIELKKIFNVYFVSRSFMGLNTLTHHDISPAFW